MKLYKRCRCTGRCAHPWWYRFRCNGREVRGSTRTANRTLAGQISARRQVALLAGRQEFMSGAPIQLSGHIRAYTEWTGARNQTAGKDPRVLAAMATVPRHQFIPASQQVWAYDDRPLPIGYRQTISQPYIVGFMSQALKLKPGDRVLEIGTGSGY